MRLRRHFAFTLIAAIGCGTPRAGEEIAEPTPGRLFPEDAFPGREGVEFIDNELLVAIFPGVDPAGLGQALEDLGASKLREMPELSMLLAQVPPAQLMNVAQALAAHPFVESVHKNYLYSPEDVPDDPELIYQDHLATIHAEEAWDVAHGSRAIRIGVIDTGVALEHPDLAPKLLPGTNTFDAEGDESDVFGHGTEVAGVAAAMTDNGAGIAGVCWGCGIIPVRATNSAGLASSADLADAIDWAGRNGAHVLNVSFAPLMNDETVLRAARSANNSGRLVFIASGNSGRPFEVPRGRTKAAVFVGALGPSTDEIATFSNTGPYLDLVAPGTGIRTTSGANGYGAVNGTSFASPIAAGVAGLIWSLRPTLRPVQVKAFLTDTAVDLGDSGRDDSSGFGRLDAGAALRAARDLLEQNDAMAPVARITSPAQDSVQREITFFVSIDASDDTEVADVVLVVDGVPTAADAIPPYRLAIDARSLAPGAHRLSCAVTDVYGNRGNCANVRLTLPIPSPCASHSTCQSCVRDPRCGMCDGNCTEGNEFGSASGSCWRWSYDLDECS